VIGIILVVRVTSLAQGLAAVAHALLAHSLALKLVAVYYVPQIHSLVRQEVLVVRRVAQMNFSMY